MRTWRDASTDNPYSAAQTVSGIDERTQVLAPFPEMGHRYWASDRHVRILLYGHYRIAYLIKNDRTIDILGVIHGALDISKYQFGWHITIRWTGGGACMNRSCLP